VDNYKEGYRLVDKNVFNNNEEIERNVEIENVGNDLQISISGEVLG
jgi:hypothetical protein